MDCSSEDARGSPSRISPHHQRRLFDSIVSNFHQACDQGDVDMAEPLLGILDALLTRRPRTPTGADCRRVDTTAGLHKRLWHLRNDPQVKLTHE